MDFSFASIFGSKPTAAPAAAAPAAPIVPANGAQPTTGAPAEAVAQPGATDPIPPTGLDLFAQLVQNNGTAPTAGAAPSFNITPETLQAATAKMDFLQGAPADAMAKIQAGDMTGLLELIQYSAKSSYQSALTHNMALTDKFVNDRLAHDQPEIDKRIARGLATSDLQTIEDLHPVAQDMFKQTMVSLQNKFPQATRAQLEGQAWKMMEEFGKQFDRTGRQQQQKADAAAPNWDAYGGFAQDQ